MTTMDKNESTEQKFLQTLFVIPERKKNATPKKFCKQKCCFTMSQDLGSNHDKSDEGKYSFWWNAKNDQKWNITEKKIEWQK